MGQGEDHQTSLTQSGSVPDVQWGLGQVHPLEPYCPLGQLPHPSYLHSSH